jgi:hypothetical protein
LVADHNAAGQVVAMGAVSVHSMAPTVISEMATPMARDYLDITELMKDTPSRLRAAALIDSVPIAFAIPMAEAFISPTPAPYGLFRDVVTAETYFELRARIADALDGANGQTLDRTQK